MVPSYLTGGNGKWYSFYTLENSLTISQNVKHRVTTWSSSTPRYLAKIYKNIHSHKNLYTHVHSSVIHNG